MLLAFVLLEEHVQCLSFSHHFLDHHFDHNECCLCANWKFSYNNNKNINKYYYIGLLRIAKTVVMIQWSIPRLL